MGAVSWPNVTQTKSPKKRLVCSLGLIVFQTKNSESNEHKVLVSAINMYYHKKCKLIIPIKCQKNGRYTLGPESQNEIYLITMMSVFWSNKWIERRELKLIEVGGLRHICLLSSLPRRIKTTQHKYEDTLHLCLEGLQVSTIHLMDPQLHLSYCPPICIFRLAEKEKLITSATTEDWRSKHKMLFILKNGHTLST